MNGVIHVLKPPGMTSSNLVAALRRILNQKKTGHTGTLDPGACGVLSVCVGRATKLADYLMESPKTYVAAVRFGAETDTLDSYGKVTQTGGGRAAPGALREACAAFTGPQEQVPPMYSAIKVNGQKMYDVARQGGHVDLKPRPVTIYAIEILEMNEAEQNCLLQIECSAGTYIRTLCADMARHMGCLGYVSFLLRSKACHAGVEACHTLEEIEAQAAAGDASFLIPSDRALENYSACMLDDYLFPIVTTGSKIDLARTKKGAQVPRDCFLRVYCRGQFIGVGRAEGSLLAVKTMYYIG